MENSFDVLLVGASFSAVPIFVALRRRGLKIAVCGVNKDDPCHKMADVSYFLDYSEPENVEKILADSNFRFVVPTCNDYSYMSCAFLAEKYGLNGIDFYETAKKINYKNYFRALLKELNLPAPKYQYISPGDDLDAISVPYPFLIKPIDSFSGRGMTLVKFQSEARNAISLAMEESRSKKGVLVEEFIEGRLHSHSAFIMNGKIASDFFVDEYCTVYPYQVNCSNFPSNLSFEIIEGMRDSILSIVKHLNLRDGLIHTQFISNSSKFWIIETMRRAPGDLYGMLIKYGADIDYYDQYVKGFLNEAYSTDSTKNITKFIARHTISTKKSGFIESVSTKNHRELTNYFPLKESGHQVEVAPYDKVGIVFSKFQSEAEMLAKVTCYDSEIKVIYYDL